MLHVTMIACILLTPMQEKKSTAKTTDKVVTVTAKAEKPAADGTQKVNVTVKIEKGYHIYANPIGNDDLDNNKSVLTVSGADLVSVDYPKGKTIVDKVLGDYNTYEKEITITAKIKRKAGATGNVEANLKCQACTDKSCLPAITIKTKVDLP